MQNFSNLRATRALWPGTIPLVNRKELSEVVAEAAARTERAAAMQREAVAEQQKAVAEQRKVVAEQQKQWAESTARWEKEQIASREAGERQERMLQDYIRRTDEMIVEGRERTKQIVAELQDQRDERRALMEALFMLMDRLPPSPPHLRSA